MSKQQPVPRSSAARSRFHQLPTLCLYLLIAASLLLLDQITKSWAHQHLPYGQAWTITPFLNLRLQYNTGIAFGWLSSQDAGVALFLVGLSIALILAVLIGLVTALYSQRVSWLVPCSLTFILGGACGNLMDRLQRGYVIDFVDFHLGHWHFATFNVADALISVAAVTLAIYWLQSK